MNNKLIKVIIFTLLIDAIVFNSSLRSRELNKNHRFLFTHHFYSIVVINFMK